LDKPGRVYITLDANQRTVAYQNGAAGANAYDAFTGNLAYFDALCPVRCVEMPGNPARPKIWANKSVDK
ncbi:MAG: hypothetical protein AB1817_22650, partial [Chloroflexota bacterium]